MVKDEFNIGDYVYYYNPQGDTIPTKIIAKSVTGKKIKVANTKLDAGPNSDRKGWVFVTKIKKQENDE